VAKEDELEFKFVDVTVQASPEEDACVEARERRDTRTCAVVCFNT
jgi:hypothetical protein